MVTQHMMVCCHIWLANGCRGVRARVNHTPDLFTPMVHANMTQLLPQVFHGKIKEVQTKLDDMGGQSTEAHVVAGGIKIAGIQERDLEYDPALYRRDRGDDWDTRSVFPVHSQVQ